MSITCSQLIDSMPELLSFVSGSKEVTIKSVCPAEKGTDGSLLFIANEKHFLTALKSPAAALVVPESHKEKAKAFVGTKTLLSSPNPTLAMALTVDKFFNPKQKSEGIHATAVVHPTAKVSKTAHLGPYVVVGENVSVGDRTRLDSHVVVEANAKIGTDTHLLAHVYVGSNCIIGNFCEVKPHSTIGSEGFGFAHDKKGNHYRIPQIGIVVLEDHVSIGANCTLDKATFEETRIGAGTKMDNMIHIAHNCVVGQNCLFAGGSMLSGSTKVGNNVVFGGVCAAAGHQTIGDNIQFAGRSAFQGDVLEAGAYGGHPLEPVRDHLRTQTSIKKLTRTIRDVRKILKHLGIDSSEKGDG